MTDQVLLTRFGEGLLACCGAQKLDRVDELPVLQRDWRGDGWLTAPSTRARCRRRGVAGLAWSAPAAAALPSLSRSSMRSRPACLTSAGTAPAGGQAYLGTAACPGDLLRRAVLREPLAQQT